MIFYQPHWQALLSSAGAQDVRKVFLPDGKVNLFKALDSRLQTLDNVARQNIRVGKIVQVGQAFILEPGDIQTGLVPRQDIFVGKSPPSSFRIGFRMIGFLAFADIFRTIARNKVTQVFQLQRVFLQGEVNVGPEVVYPDLFRPGCFCCRMIVEEQYIGLDALLVKTPVGKRRMV